MNILIVILFLLIGFKCDPTKRTLDDWSCAQHEKLREECGWIGITQEQCEANNCCYAESYISDVPWCFKGIDDVPTYSTLYSSLSCGLDREKRVECGYKGIKKDECESRDCCYKIDDYESDVPWCFQGYKDEIVITIEDKVSYVSDKE